MSVCFERCTKSSADSCWGKAQVKMHKENTFDLSDISACISHLLDATVDSSCGSNDLKEYNNT